MTDTLIYDLDLIAGNPNNNITIALSGDVNSFNNINLPANLRFIKGFQFSDIRFSGSNEFNTPLDNDVITKINEYARLGTAIANNAGARLSNFIIQTQQQTSYVWTGSKRFGFTVDLLFISYRRLDRNVLNALKSCIATCFPFSTGDASIGELFTTASNTLNAVTAEITKGGLDLTNIAKTTINGIKTSKFAVQTIAPLGYFAYDDKNGSGVASEGTHAVKIGKWFMADKLVVSNFDYNISKEKIDDGLPLFATVSITFESFKVLSAQEILAFIIDPGDIKNQSISSLVP